MSVVELNDMVVKFEILAGCLENVASSLPAPVLPRPGATASLLASFDAAMMERLKLLEKAAQDLGARDVLEATELFMAAIGLLRDMLAATSKCKRPQDGDWPSILVPVMDLGRRTREANDKHSDYFQHRKSAAEALNVVMLGRATSPPSWVRNCLHAMDFHVIKVIEKRNVAETAWVKALKASVRDLEDWCTEECRLGVAWNMQGADPVEYFKAHPLGSASYGVKPKSRATADNLLMVSKSPTAKASASLKQKSISLLAAAGMVSGKGPKGSPRMELERGSGWMIENYEGVHDLVLDKVEPQQLICVLNCKNVSMQIKAKVKSISIDGCDGVNVVCQDVISAVELVNCDRCMVRTVGKVNSFAIDKCQGANIYLSRESVDAELVTSKSSDMSVTVPEEGSTGFVEIPIPEQFVSRVVGGKSLKTDPQRSNRWKRGHGSTSSVPATPRTASTTDTPPRRD